MRLPSRVVTETGAQPEWLNGESASRALAAERDDVDAEAGERRRADAARLTISDRLAAAIGQSLTLTVLGGHRASGQLEDTGDGWLRLANGARDLVVRTQACLTVDGLAAWGTSGVATDSGRSRTSAGHPLRALMRARQPVAVLLVDGSRLTGTLVQVGVDAVDLVAHPVDRLPRPTDPVATVAWSGVSAVGAP